MKTKNLFATRLGVVISFNYLLGSIIPIPGLGLLVIPLTWVLIGEWWHLIFFLEQTRIAMRMLPEVMFLGREMIYKFPLLIENAEALMRDEGWLPPGVIDILAEVFVGDPPMTTQYLEALFPPGIIVLFYLVVQFGLGYLVVSFYVNRYGPKIEKQAEKILGYKPRML